MKKITLTIGLVAAMLSTKAQDTTDVVVTKTKVYYFERGTTNCTKQYAHNNNIVFYASEYEVIQFHLLDNKLRTRKVFITYPNGEVVYKILDSKNNVYVTKTGPLKLVIDTARFFQKL